MELIKLVVLSGHGMGPQSLPCNITRRNEFGLGWGWDLHHQKGCNDISTNELEMMMI